MDEEPGQVPLLATDDGSGETDETCSTPCAVEGPTVGQKEVVEEARHPSDSAADRSLSNPPADIVETGEDQPHGRYQVFLPTASATDS